MEKHTQFILRKLLRFWEWQNTTSVRWCHARRRITRRAFNWTWREQLFTCCCRPLHVIGSFAAMDTPHGKAEHTINQRQLWPTAQTTQLSNNPKDVKIAKTWRATWKWKISSHRFTWAKTAISNLAFTFPSFVWMCGILTNFLRWHFEVLVHMRTTTDGSMEIHGRKDPTWEQNDPFWGCRSTVFLLRCTNEPNYPEAEPAKRNDGNTGLYVCFGDIVFLLQHIWFLFLPWALTPSLPATKLFLQTLIAGRKGCSSGFKKTTTFVSTLPANAPVYSI